MLNGIKNLIYKSIKVTWHVGIFEGNIEDIMEGRKPKFHLVKHNYKDRWFADTFVLDVTDDTIILLVEEFYYPINRGRLSKMVVSREDYRLLSLTTILELDTHLSFPFIIRKDNKIYICPENYKANEFAAYEYDAQKDICKKVKILLHEPVVDTVLTQINGSNLLFTSLGNGNKVDIYKKNEATDSYCYLKSCTFDRNIGRNAGAIFSYQGKLYRPAQDCGLCYGHFVSIQEIITKHDDITMKEVAQLRSPNTFRFLGIHTLNSYKGVVVGDVTIYKYPIIGCPLYWLKEHFNLKISK